MTTDKRVATAIAHWAPRFVANGVSLTDFEDVTRTLSSWDDWCRVWSERAAVHEGLGREALAEGHLLSAGEHLDRAAIYYHFAKFLFVHDLDQMRAAHLKAVECKMLALPHLTPPGERVTIPFGDDVIAGILRKPAGVTKPPVLVMAPGLDSTKEELEAYEMPFLARGMATLTFDGPGQGEAEYRHPIRGDYEVAVTAIVDWLMRARSDLDTTRIGMWGVSLGGYYAPRAVAFEKRIKACVAISGPFDWFEIWDRVPGLTREAFRVRSHLKTDAEAREHARSVTLKDCVANITCPLFIVAGRQDPLVPWQDAERLASRVRGPVKVVMVEDGSHNANNRPYRYRTQSADWMAAQLGLPKV